MYCQECGKIPATVTIKEQGLLIQLCQECALKRLQKNLGQQPSSVNQGTNVGNIPPQGLNPQIIALIPILQGNIGMNPMMQQNVISDISCKTCGFTFKEFIMLGKFSCPDCYEAFSSEIRKHILKNQGYYQYKGKFPARGYKHLRILKLIDHLKSQLNEEVKKENYENAVKIRDTIKNLEQEVEKFIKTTTMD